MKLHFIIHESFEAPAAIEAWAQHNQHQVSYSRVYQGDALPSNVEDFDMLIIMGGPQSPNTTLAECAHFDAAAEMQLIRDAIAADKRVLGVCLGAQLIGQALGAKVERSPNKEVGCFALTLTDAAKDDPIFCQFPKTFTAGHWHGDMPGLTDTASVIAYSDGCPRQIIRYTPNAYGFQCHLEFTKDAIEQMIKHAADDLVVDNQQGKATYIQTATELRENNYQEANNMLFKFLDTFVSH